MSEQPLDIEVRIDRMLLERRMTLAELADRVGVTYANLSILKNNHARAIRFSTLARLCEALDCQPGDLLRWTGGGGARGRGDRAQTRGCTGRRCRCTTGARILVVRRRLPGAGSGGPGLPECVVLAAACTRRRSRAG